MKNRTHFLLLARLCVALPLCLLLAAGCSKPSDSSNASSGSTSEGQMSSPPPGGGQPGGLGGRMPGGGGPGGLRGGGRGTPVAENASGTEIYQAKCGCHGPEGKGGRAPVLTGGAGKSEAELTIIIHDGKGKMPAFGSQLSEAQIKKVVAYVKDLK